MATSAPFSEVNARPTSEQLQRFADMVAGLLQFDEHDGMPDVIKSLGTLDAVIGCARTLSDAERGRFAYIVDPFEHRTDRPSKVLRTPAFSWMMESEQGDGYPFRAPTEGSACPTCKGTGEVVDYPPDDDERLIACGRCGGTGEQIR